ncbi:MAG: hypothetical protein ACI8ZM_004332 [Crocinitomix sp.]
MGLKQIMQPFNVGYSNSPFLQKELRKRKKRIENSWRMDETYIKVKGEWKYLYRAVDKEGNMLFACGVSVYCIRKNKRMLLSS